MFIALTTPLIGSSINFLTFSKEPVYLLIITARKRSLRRLCFHRCLSVHSGVGCLPHCMLGYIPPGPEADTSSPGPDTSPPPENRHLPRADTQPRGPDTPRSRHPPKCMLGDTGNKRAVRILLECILVFIFIAVFIINYNVLYFRKLIFCNIFENDVIQDSINPLQKQTSHQARQK